MIDFDKIVEEYLASNFQPVYRTLVAFKQKAELIVPPTELAEFKPFYKNIAKLEAIVDDLTVKLNVNDIQNSMQEYFEKETAAFVEKEHSIHQKYEQLLDSKKHALQEEAVLHNNTVTAEWAAENQKYMKLEDKRKKLEEYSDVIQEVCKMYGIVSSDCNLTADDFTAETLNTEYDKSLAFLQKKGRSLNIISAFRRKIANVYIQFSILMVLFLLCFSSVLDVLSIILFLLLAVKQFGVGHVVKTYARIYAVTFNIQPLNMGYQEAVDNSKLESVDIDDEDERLGEVISSRERELGELNEVNPETELDAAKIEYAARYFAIEKLFTEKKRSCINLQEELKGIFAEKMEQAKGNEQEAKSKIKYLCERYKKDYVLDANFALGLKDNVIEEFVDIGHRNVVIRPGNNPKLLADFMQVIIANLFLNIKGNLIDITVIDPNSRCKDFMMFYDQQLTKDSLHLNEVDLNTALTDALVFLDKNMKEMHGTDIATFNKSCQERNSTPREYKVIFIVSQTEELLKKEDWLGTLRSSAKYGLIFWMITDEDVSAIQDDIYIFTRPFAGVTQPYPVPAGAFVDKFKTCYAQLLSDSKMPPLTYSTFMERFAPEEKKWWNRRRLAETDKSIKAFSNDFIHICPGYYEGDPDKPDEYAFGHKGDVHMLGVGGTGAGKSVFLNFVILQLCTIYSPEELELWLVDFKGTEFSKYIASPLNNYKALPHVKACLCTSDGDFAGSLYTAFAQDSRNRNDLFNTVGVKSLPEYNKKMMQQGTPEKRLPRVLMINDEFQVIFQKTEPKVLDQIKVDMGFVAKLGRSTGHHMFFTSQSMSGTLSADIQNMFALRFALKCKADVSTAILDSKVASTIKEPNGFLYVRCGEHVDTSNLPKYRTPFIDDERPVDKNGKETGEMSQVEKAICAIYDEAQKIGFKQERVITYKEATMHSISEIIDFYKKNSQREEELKDLFLLGESMTYTVSTAPQHAKLTAKNNKHIYSVFNSYKDLVNFYKTMLYNIQNAVQACSFIANSQVADLHYLCELDKDVPEDLQMLSTEKTTIKEFISFANDIYHARVESNKKDEPLYFICIGWDKGSGFGIEKDMSLVSKLQVLLQKCAEFHMHFIFILSANGAIPESIRGACSYRICGKASEDDSMSVINSRQAYKAEMKEDFFYLLENGTVTRGKVYQYEITRQIASDKLSF